VLAYQTAFRQTNMSLSMTMMVIFAVIVLAVVIAYQRVGVTRGTNL
jgi:ABC-type sugar transport system permease subunit